MNFLRILWVLCIGSEDSTEPKATAQHFPQRCTASVGGRSRQTPLCRTQSIKLPGNSPQYTRKRAPAMPLSIPGTGHSTSPCVIPLAGIHVSWSWQCRDGRWSPSLCSSEWSFNRNTKTSMILPGRQNEKCEPLSGNEAATPAQTQSEGSQGIAGREDGM